ncbi:hypothetical protein RF11_13481 [Thelohanellus kitauei]|uniref:Uncharacterized protein n=1 Tax=Thelohanellus kitauei TaxID=669202 RepID=A0A0C2MLI6_THEKT|nr:hypothetical protein RF11_13481 [Thelohanellus kitauei]
MEEQSTPAAMLKDLNISNQDHFMTSSFFRIFTLRTCPKPHEIPGHTTCRSSTSIAIIPSRGKMTKTNLYQSNLIYVIQPTIPTSVCLTYNSQTRFCKFSMLNSFPKSKHLPIVVEVGVTLQIINSDTRPRSNLSKEHWQQKSEIMENQKIDTNRLVP